MDAAAAGVGEPRRRAVPVGQLLGAPGLFEIDMLRGRQRELVRVTVPRRQLGWIVDWLAGEGLAVRRWMFDMETHAERSLDGFSVSGRLVLADTHPGASPVLFVARDPARLASVDALALDNYWQGVALGYPRCCIANFCSHAASFVAGYESYFAGHEGPFGCWANVFAEPFGHLLLSHLPCSPECAESRAMAQAALAFLLREAPGRALQILAGLRRVIAYHPGIGILSLSGARDETGWLADDAAMTGSWRQYLSRGRLAAVPAGTRVLDFGGDL